MNTSKKPDDLAILSYLRLRTQQDNKFFPRRRKKKSLTGGQAFTDGRDPNMLDSVLDEFTEERGWNVFLARENLIEAWPTFVGAEIAAQTEVRGINDGVLYVECTSTAWATQLRLMRVRLLAELEREYPESGVEQIRFLQPVAPSWKRGFRSVPGRGQRDTYG